MTSTSMQTSCVVCIKNKGTFRCEGCAQTFCSKDSIHHRQELSQKLEDIELKRNLIYQILIQQVNESTQNRLFNDTNQWEQQAITEVHQIVEKIPSFEQQLKDITNELRDAREGDSFIESYLIQWRRNLDKLEDELINAQTIADKQNFETNIHIAHQNQADAFQCPLLDSNVCLVVKNNCIGFSAVLGKNEYTIGQHIIHFRIGHVLEDGWILVGITSKLALTNIKSHELSRAHGLTTWNQFTITSQYRKDRNHGIITLIIDCDQRKIQLKNEPMDHILELSIDISQCPFPWTLYFNILTASTAISILPSINQGLVCIH